MNMNMNMNILLVEDNPGDARLTIEALKESPFEASSVHHVHDGLQALEYLSETSRLDQTRIPDLILLDLNMPRKDGRELLHDMSANDRLSRIPTVILTTSNAPDDINDCFDLCANCYVTKPVEFDEYIDTVKSIHSFWATTSKKPTH